MKKYLLGALMVLGVAAYGQTNSVIEKIEGNNATASIPVLVEGTVHDETKASLVVDITSHVSNNGKSFAFSMPDTFKGGETKDITGTFKARVMKNNNEVPLGEADLVAKLNGTKDKVTTGLTEADLVYTLSSNKTTKSLDGSLNVAVTPKATGSYTDNSVKLDVILTRFVDA